MEEYERVEDREGGVIENAREHNVFQVLEPICVMNLSLNVVILDIDDFFEFGLVG